jgi:hypothetical protein
MKKIQDQNLKLVIALAQVDNLFALTEGNEYETYLQMSLWKIKSELERQMKKSPPSLDKVS